MEIKEIKEIKLNNQNIILPNDYWLNIKNGLMEKNINIEIENFNVNIRIGDEKNIVQICNQNDFHILLEKLSIETIDLEMFRLKVIHTKKWGDKLIYNEGAKSICFSCCYIKNEKGCYMIFFNTDGSKEVENIYIHGIWRKLYIG